MPLNDQDDSVSSNSAPVLSYDLESPVSPSSSSTSATAAGSDGMLTVNPSNLPTLLSKSPPPFDSTSLGGDDRTVNEKLDGFFDAGAVDVVGVQDLNLSTSDTFSLPNPSPAAHGGDDRTPPTDEATNRYSSDTTNNSNFVHADPVQSDTSNQPETFQTSFNAFETEQSTGAAGSADWVNFDQVNSAAWASPVPTAGQTSSVNSKDPNNDEDDEWSDFAEPKPFEFTPAPPPRPAVVNTVVAPAAKPSPLSGQMLIDLDAFIEQIFAKTPASLLAEQAESSANRVPTDFPILIDEDLVWQHIQRFTTETDASDSLQFKWKLSELESSFLSSLCLQRAPSLPKKFKTKSIPSYIYNMSNILQPTKVDSKAGLPNKPAELVEQISPTTKPASADTSSDTSSTKSGGPGPEAAASSLNPNQMMDLDLSFFEKSSSSSSVKSSSSKAGSAKQNLPSSAKPESNSIYLNKLLQDIFHQPQAPKPALSPVPSSTNSNGGVPKPAPTVNHKKPETTDKNYSKVAKPVDYFAMQLEPAKLLLLGQQQLQLGGRQPNGTIRTRNLL